MYRRDLDEAERPFVPVIVDDNGFFFFQAEDGIRDYKVTGVQTCALPISVSYEKLIDDYLNEAHRDNPGTGCAFSALAPEIARSDKRTRALTSEQVRNDIQLKIGRASCRERV